MITSLVESLHWIRACCGFAVLFANVASCYADVFKWEYVDPSNPALGKRRSVSLTAGGAGANFNTVIGLSGRDLTMAYLYQANMRTFRVGTTILNDAYLAASDLYNLQADGLVARNADMSGTNLQLARFENADLSGTNFAGADLKGGTLAYATLAGASFRDANVNGVNFSGASGKGFTASQLSQTASYQRRDLTGVKLGSNDLSSWDFTGQNLTSAEFAGSRLANATFTDAIIVGANFGGSSLSPAQLYATASYKSRKLDDLQLYRSDLTGFNFSNQSLLRAGIGEAKLSGAVFDGAQLPNAAIGGGQFTVQSDVSFRGANLSQAIFDTNGRWERADFTGANLEKARLSNNGFVNSTFTDAVIRGAKLESVFNFGFTIDNLYSTRSYLTGDLTGIEILYGDLTSARFAGKNFTGATLRSVQLKNADFRGANLTNAYVGNSVDGADFSDANLTGAVLVYDPVSFISFRGANLSGALFERTSLRYADFTDANVYGTKLSVENSPQDLTATQLYSTASYKAGLLGPITLAGDMRGWDFRNQNAAGARFDRGAKLDGARWDGANLQGVTFFVNSLPGADFRQAALRNAVISSCVLNDSDFSGLDLTGVELNSSSLQRARFVASRLTGVLFIRGDLSDAILTDSDLRGSRFFSVRVTGADFHGARIQGVDLSYADDSGFTLDQLRSTRSFQDRDLSGVNFSSFELPRIDLSRFQLVGTNFTSVDLGGANLSRADLTSATLAYANVSNVDFTDAIIRRAGFGSAVSRGFTRQMFESTTSFKQHRLDGVDISYNDLRGWDFRGQDLRGANFTGSQITGTLFEWADLRGASLPTGLTGVDLQRMLRPDGTIQLLQLQQGQTLTIGAAPTLKPTDPTNPRDPYSTGPIPLGVKVTGLTARIDGMLAFLLDESAWTSTVVFKSNATVDVGGVLSVAFDESANPMAAIGRTFDLFDWPAGGPNGRFTIVQSPGQNWDFSQLYTTGAVTFIGIVPEPSSGVLCAVLTCVMATIAKRRKWSTP